jgi:DNA-binding response OmpR family regulator
MSLERLLAKKILVVEDEPTLCATLKYNLERDGYTVWIASDGEAGLASARKNRPGLIVLDIMLPGLDGLEVCRILRRETTVPIILLTAKSEEIDKVVGLEIGADDYITKPFSTRELLARVRALLRRAESQPESQKETLNAGPIMVDQQRRQAFRDGEALTLKPKEYDLLSYLMNNRGRAFTRDQLLNNVWGYDFVGDSRTVDVHVRWLREKIEEEPSKPVRLITVRGVGYRFDG